MPVSVFQPYRHFLIDKFFVLLFQIHRSIVRFHHIVDLLCCCCAEFLLRTLICAFFVFAHKRCRCCVDIFCVFQAVQKIRIVIVQISEQTVELSGQASETLSEVDGIAAQILFDGRISESAETVAVSSAAVKAEAGAADDFIS